MLSISSLTCLVIGNGPSARSLPGAPVDICITFNRREPPCAVKWHLDVISCRSGGAAGSKIEITGEGPEGFADRLREAALRTAYKHESALGCWPSTGFSTLHGLWECDIVVKARGIGFDPSLSRDRHVGPRSAPPAMYHNWLGERRLSFARWLTAPPAAWDWPLMQPSITPPQHSSQVLRSPDLLIALASARATRRLDDLAKILTVPLRAEPAYISAKASHIEALEQCFHLARDVRETPNWWLYDEYGSVIIDTLAQRIRACQSALFAAAFMRPTTPAG